MRHLVKTGAAGAGLALSIMGAALAQQPQGAPPAAAAAPATPAKPSTPPQPDWTTWGYDQERTAWNRGETTLNKDNVSKLKLLWSTQTTTPVSDVALATLTTPLVAMDVRTPSGRKNLVYVLDAFDTLFALDADSGKIVWHKNFPNTLKPLRAGTWLCPNTANATPVIDKQRGLVFVLTSDGRLRAVSAGDGSQRMAATDFVAPFSRSWSLNLIDDVVYTTSGRGCASLLNPRSPISAASTVTSGGRGGAPVTQAEPGSVSAVDVSDLKHPTVTHFFTSGGRTAGPWGRGGVAKTPKGIVVQTADGPNDPAMGDFGESLLELTPKATRLMDSFTPSTWPDMNQHDLDFGSASPLVFPFQGRMIVAASSKQAIIYLLDAAALGGKSPDHSTPLYTSPLLANENKQGVEPGQGVWGAMATYETPDGRRFLYVPIWGPPASSAPVFKNSAGPIPNGSIMAFEVTMNGANPTLVPQWTSPNMTVADPPSVANGVVYALQSGEQTLQIRPRPPGSPPAPGRGGAGAPPGGGRGPADAPPAQGGRGGNPNDFNAFRATPVSNLILYAFDAETGKQLYSSDKIITNWTHFSEPVVALGKVFVVTHDAHVYAFGLGK